MNNVVHFPPQVFRDIYRKIPTASVLWWRMALYITLALGGAIMLAPFIYILTTSLKDAGHVYAVPPQWVPIPPHFENYLQIFRVAPFHTYFFNTTIITVVNIVLNLVSNSIVAFGFARLSGRGRDTLFILLIATLMVPPQVTLIPQFLLYKTLGWYDTFLPLTVPSLFGNALYIFLLRQYMMTIPRELDDAAKIDGCNWFMTYRHVILPLSTPALITIIVLDFLANWNAFFGPLIYLSSESHKTLSLGLATFQGYLYSSPRWHLMMAATVLVMLPCLMVFFFLQRYLTEGIVVGQVKN